MRTKPLRDWEAFMRAQGRSDNTIRQYRYALLRLMSEIEPADKDWADITEQDVVVFLASLGTRAHSKQLYLRAFRSFFGWAAERNIIAEDPSRHLRPKAPPERDPDAFTPEEVVMLMSAARKHRDGTRRAAAILVAYALGLRRSELCRLRPDEIDWTSRRVHITDSKGGKSRWVEANDLALTGLDTLRPWWNGTVVGGWDPNWFTMIVHDAAKAAGFPPGRRNAHMLRSSFATALLAEGVPISVVSKLLGHSQVATTARYLSVRAQDRREAVDKLRLG